MNIQAATCWLFTTTPQRTRHISRWCGEPLHFLAQVIGDTAVRATQFLLQVFISSEIHSADGSGRLVGESPSPMKKKNRRNNAPFTATKPNIENAPVTPGSLLRAFVTLFTEHYAPANRRDDARDLDMLLMLDPSAVDDLIVALFQGQQPTVATPAGMNMMVAALRRVGALEIRHDHLATAEIGMFTFHARPLLDLLKAMSHRDPCLGIRRELLDDCTEQNETNNEKNKDWNYEVNSYPMVRFNNKPRARL